jgi:DNA-binding transcriptional LysR family regulator
MLYIRLACGVRGGKEHAGLCRDERAELSVDRMVNLVDDGIDLALRIGRLEDSSLIVRKTGETRRVVVASPAYLERHGVPSVPQDLGAHQAIQALPLASTLEWTFRAAPHGAGEMRVSVATHYVTNSIDAALWHAEHGGGLTLALSYQVMQSVQAGRSRVVLTEYEPPPLPIQWVYPTSRLLSAKVRAFIDLATRESDWRFA